MRERFAPAGWEVTISLRFSSSAATGSPLSALFRSNRFGLWYAFSLSAVVGRSNGSPVQRAHVTRNQKEFMNMTRFLAPLALALSLAVAGQASAQVGTAIFQENFDGLTLGPSVNIRNALNPTTEVVARFDAPGTIPHQNAFTHTPPAGWVVHQDFDNFGNVDLNNLNHAPDDIVGNIGLGSKGNPDSGVDEWEGWSFADSDFWLVADGQRREEFTNGLANHSNIAIADSDEYDDFGAGDDGFYYNTGMSTGNISVAGRSNVNFTLDSSWRDEAFDEEMRKSTTKPRLSTRTSTAPHPCR
jgi:hypothetical protein